MLRLSQGQLTVLETCPRRFQYLMLEQLSAPLVPEQQTRIEWGDRFHMLMQQDQMQLPLAPLLQSNQELSHAFEVLHQAAPDLFLEQRPDQHILSEHLRSLSIEGHSFSVVYDLLVAEPERGRIIDWKTYPRPQNAQWLENHWQTKLYCYSLVETSGYRPEQVSMTYWFVRGSRGKASEASEASENGEAGEARAIAPQSLHFAYDGDRHQKVRAELAELLSQLDRWLALYQGGSLLPQIEHSPALNICESCPFLGRCRGNDWRFSERTDSAASPAPYSLAASVDLESVEEVKL